MVVKSNYSPRKYGAFLDWLHILMGIAIVIMAIFAFTNPNENMVLFPMIFFLAAVLNLLTGWAYLKLYPRMKKKRASGAAYLAAGALILILGVVSAISIWGGL